MDTAPNEIRKKIGIGIGIRAVCQCLRITKESERKKGSETINWTGSVNTTNNFVKYTELKGHFIERNSCSFVSECAGFLRC